MAKEIEIIKKPHRKEIWTEAQLVEVAKCIHDPIYFIKKYIKVQHPLKGRVPLKLYDYQEEIIDGFHNYRNNILLCSRQMGKCVFGDSVIKYDSNEVKIKDLIQLNLKERIIDKLETKLIESSIKKTPSFFIKSLLWLLDKDHRIKEDIVNDVKKFTHIESTNFDSNFAKCTKVFRTIPYDAFYLKTESKSLVAADKHIVIKNDGTEVYVKDLKVNDVIKTKDGNEKVIQITDLKAKTHMYCVEINDDDHLYYANDILSHNTTCAAAYLLWYATFHKDKTILICANKLNQAIEIMDRIRYSYENMEDHNWIRPGVVEYNKGSITFDNGSSIVARATTKDAGRGLSVSILYCLDGSTDVTIRSKLTDQVEEINLKDLYERLKNENRTNGDTLN